MGKTQTGLLKFDNLALRVIHLAERFQDAKIDIPEEAFEWETQDCFLVICEHDNKYLIGKLKQDYEFCPNDWDFLTPHAKEGDNWKKKVLWAPQYYAELKPTRILRAYHTFMWLDLDSKLWWHFIPFKVEVEDKKFQLDPNKKYSEFRWVKKSELSRFSRQGYFKDVCGRTLDVDHHYVEDYTTVYDVQRGYYSFFPFRD